VRNNPSLIHDGVYGFNPFHEAGIAYASFPSGHTAAICALMSVLWICYPRFWPVYLAAILAVSIGLVGADYHFLSDVIAGAFVGTSAGWMLVAAWHAGCRRVSSGAAEPEPVA
jgi:membrane-associated phospholipid phosphatase